MPSRNDTHLPFIPFRSFSNASHPLLDLLLTHSLAAKRPFRRSLTYTGIPNHRDALAVYFRWVRRSSYRAHPTMWHDAASSAVSVIVYPELDAYDGQDFSTAAIDISFDAERLRVDLLGVGERFGDEGMGLAYPCQIDING
jgi:hypothetical protein